MATLQNTKIKDTYPALLKASDNGVIGATEKVITDGLGNDSVLKLGTASASFTSDIEVNSLTIGKGSGSIATNTAIGSGALANNTTGSSNVAIGYFSLPDNTTGVRNIAVGNGALADNTTGQDNVAVGHNSGALNTGGNSNTSLGSNSLYSNTASGNTAVGSYSLNANTSATQNTAVGADALRENTASSNTAVGHSSLGLNTTGAYNTGVGVSALYANQTGGNNTALGYLSLRNNTADYNTAVGSGSLYDNTSGTFNVALGYNSLYNNTTGNNNTAVGVDSLRNNTTGGNNTALGLHALRSNTEGNHNTSVGAYSLDVNTVGLRNTSVGYSALSSNTEGDDNTAVGYNSLVANTTGGYNVGIGRNALLGTSTGSRNVSLGYAAGDSNTTGTDNIYIGYNADGSAATNTNEIVIGTNATGKGSNTSLIAGDYVYLGDGTLGSAIIERIANPAIVLIDTANSETFNITNNYIGGQVNYNSTTLNHIFRIGGDIKLTIGSSSVSVSDALSVTGNLAVDTNTLYVDAASNKVGIGVSNPADYAFTNLVVGNTSADGGVTIVSGTSSVSRLLFADGSAAPNEYIGGVQYFHSDNSMRLYTNDSERMRIDSSGNVLVGTTNAVPLTDDGAVLGSSGYVYASRSSDIALFANRLSTDGDVFAIRKDGSTVSSFGVASSGLTIGVNGSERMRIDSSGNVGIGNSSPSGYGKFVVQGTGNLLNINATSGVASQGFYENGTGRFYLKTLNGSDGLGFYDGDGTSERMRITSGGFLKASNTGSYLSASGSYHEHRQSTDAEVINYNSHSGTNPYGQIIRFSGSAPNNTTNWFMSFSDTSAERFKVWSNGNVVNSNNSYGAISDSKLKENVVDASPKLDDLLQVKVRNFNYIGDDKKQLGVVAQELEEVFPSMIDESPDFEEQEVIDEEGNVTKERVDLGTTTKSVKYSVFVPMLIKAMQEQQEIINDLKARIETLEAK